MRKYQFLILMLAVAGLFAGCKHSTSANTSPPAVVYPNPGSYYIVQNTITNSDGTILSVDTEKDAVLAINVSIYGESGVTEILDSGKTGWGRDTAYFIYQNSGDLLSFQTLPGSRVQRSWVTMPIGSQASVNWAKLNTTIADTTEDIFESATGNGVLIFNIQNQTVGTEDAIVSDSDFDTIGHVSITTISQFAYDFAPTLGYFAEVQGPQTTQPGANSPFIQKNVIDFLIK